jgi:heparinase II/III-like protein
MPTDFASSAADASARLSIRTVTRLGWYVNRVRCMSPAEMVHRMGRAARLRAERWGFAADTPIPAPDLTATGRAWIAMPLRADQLCLGTANRIVEGRFDIFAMHQVFVGMPPHWNRDPKTGLEAPLRFGKLLNYRDAELVGDIKYVWELNRHLHLVTLAQAYALTGESRYADTIVQHLESWWSACPYMQGPNWTSALEAGLRLISWSATWQILDACPLAHPRIDDADFRARWLRSVYEHASFISGYFSLYSSANNHLLGEAAGLYIAAITWPCWPRSHTWRTEAKRILEEQSLLQNSPDGVNREQAVAYQRFGLELLVLCWLAAERNGEPFSATFGSRIEGMLEYLASIMDVAGNVPMVGDSDDATALLLDFDSGHCAYRALLATGSLLFNRADFKAKAGALDERTRWLIRDADDAYARLQAPKVGLPVRQAFPEGGYYILGCEFETPNEIRLIADAGPLGYQAIAAHGHADALAFTLSVGGFEFFVDPGTYAYHTQQEWRAYFRGTGAHNTLRIDGRDQSQSGGNFMWVSKAQAVCSTWSSTDAEDIFEGQHDGYMDLVDPVLHQRRITVNKPARHIVIEDFVQMKDAHTLELFFHCSEACKVKAAEQGYEISNGSKRVRLMLPALEGTRHCIHYGSRAPLAGWISRRFDYKQPAPTIAWHARLRGDVRLRCEIACPI